MNDEPQVPQESESTATDAVPEIAESIDVQVVNPVPAEDVIASTDTESVASETGPEPPPSPSVSLEPLQTRLDELGQDLSRRLDGLQALFEREIRAESSREKVVDRLHAELQEYKQDLVQSLLKPVFVDLIQLHDDIGKVIEAQAEPSSDSAQPLGPVLGSIQQGIEDILYRQGVEPFTTDHEQFDPRRQRAVSTVPTSEASQAKTIAVRLRRGFTAGEKIIRPEMVKVFAYKPELG